MVARDLDGSSQTGPVRVTQALHGAFLTLAAVTVLSSLTFWRLAPEDGQSVSRGEQAA